jgi:hypothetical protein
LRRRYRPPSAERSRLCFDAVDVGQDGEPSVKHHRSARGDVERPACLAGNHRRTKSKVGLDGLRSFLIANASTPSSATAPLSRSKHGGRKCPRQPSRLLSTDPEHLHYAWVLAGRRARGVGQTGDGSSASCLGKCESLP